MQLDELKSKTESNESELKTARARVSVANFAQRDQGVNSEISLKGSKI